MSDDGYQDLQDLLRTKWDLAILELVSQGPDRFLNLARRARDVIDPSLVENNVTRSLRRLRSHGLVELVPGEGPGPPFHVYQLTAEGRRALAAYHAMRGVYQDCP